MGTKVIFINLILFSIGIGCIRFQNQQKKIDLKPLFKKVFIPGIILGILTLLLIIKDFQVQNIVSGVLFGILICEMLYILHLSKKNFYGTKNVTVFYDDGTPPRFFITGDKHRDFEYIKDFCQKLNTRKKDVLIVLGDAGFNYFGDMRDDKLKSEVSELNITLFCIHGNKENRPQNIPTYGIKNFCGAKVYYEPRYPNILFAIDGEVYNFEGKKYMVVGGAHSVDKMRCLENNTPFWEDEMPNEKIKARVELELECENNNVYGMLTHTCPISYLPTEMFISTHQSNTANKSPRKLKSAKPFKLDIDRSTELWLDDLEKKINYEVWYCGHYHVDKQIDKINMMYHEIRPLHTKLYGENGNV